GSFSSRFSELVGEPPSSYRARDHDALEAMPACIVKILGRPQPMGTRSIAGRSSRNREGATA
ncbi:MAG: AraC family transcriptional regulator, partial [Pseudolysinimonas sp.]